jgi:hypothetical protein
VVIEVKKTIQGELLFRWFLVHRGTKRGRVLSLDPSRESLKKDNIKGGFN